MGKRGTLVDLTGGGGDSIMCRLDSLPPGIHKNTALLIAFNRYSESMLKFNPHIQNNKMLKIVSIDHFYIFMFDILRKIITSNLCLKFCFKVFF